jgi:cystathionine beta-lyase/cystathionine gamma-synthase
MMTTTEGNTSMTEKKRKNYCTQCTEVPSNSLLQTPDLTTLCASADEHDFIASFVEDTTSNFPNVDLLLIGLADAVSMILTTLMSRRVS